MKIKEKITIFIFLLIFILVSYANNSRADNNKDLKLTDYVPRVVLVELFVQENCSTCPTAEFCLEDLAWEYGTEKLILVEEHLWGDGYDTPETNARYNWYVGKSKKGTPDVFINGLTKRIRGLACDCGDIDENYLCYKEAIDYELTRPAFLEVSAAKKIYESNIIIEGSVKNVSDIPLKDLVVCGMIYKERDKTGLYCCVQDVFPFQSIPLFLPGDSFSFKFVSELLVDQESNEENLHTIVFVQNLETKEVLQAFYVN